MGPPTLSEHLLLTRSYVVQVQVDSDLPVSPVGHEHAELVSAGAGAGP
jgi:hypothetical protein